MTRRRWIADEFSPALRSAAITGANAEHLVRVLRARVGQQFEVAGGDESNPHLATIVSIAPSRVEFELNEELPISAPLPSVTLLLSVFKFDRMEWAIEKSVELGVQAIVPVLTRRTEKHLAYAAAKRHQRWQRIAREAAQQSRRSSVPDIHAPLKLSDAVALQFPVRIVLAETGAKNPLRDLLPTDVHAEIALAIGPEGGWSPEELKLFLSRGWQSATLGPTILRAETAAIAALAIAMAHF